MPQPVNGAVASSAGALLPADAVTGEACDKDQRAVGDRTADLRAPANRPEQRPPDPLWLGWPSPLIPALPWLRRAVSRRAVPPRTRTWFTARRGRPQAPVPAPASR